MYARERENSDVIACIRQTKLCLQQAAVSLWRNRRVVFARIFRAIIIGFLIGTLFFNLGLDELGANNRMSLMYFCITFTALGSIASIPQVRFFQYRMGSHLTID